MLSLPIVPAQYSDYTPFLSTSWHPRAHSPPPAFGAQQQQHQQQQHHSQRQQRQQREDEKLANARSSLALLAADEAAIAQRKSAVRNFGSYWIRPPGIPKTLQAQTEEEAERAEQEELARQERGMLDLQAQQQLEETRQRAAEAAAEAEAGDREERDLDDDIPEAEEADESNVDISGTGGTTIQSESLLGGSSQIEQRDIENENEMEEAELTGIARDEEDLGMERDLDMEQDLDNSVPEAGSYEHTDTEAEDSESDSELHDSFAYQSARRSARQIDRSQASLPSSAFRAPPQSELRASRLHDRFLAQEDLPRSPGSLNLSSSILESSFIGSSPVMQRSNQSARGRRDGRQRGRPS
ncbi:hypothetical protein K431DRAFT_284293 [Polychaeton citri CBS 116435]|uniref:Uncharacterized protein n=1 Tax=Polychaeton citri CBS 116435 TaxID=1314669 RepID=A0A9P4Q7L2_9PEZI|nr:hypothetical protein K431DRAFT_284293 [Polychaeton citri CBS 116435]